MKQLLLLMLIAAGSLDSFGQFFNKKAEINYSDPFQVDSSQYFMIPKLIGDDNQAAYGKGKGYLPTGFYNEIYFYNAGTGKTKKLFGAQLAIINPLTPARSWYYQEKQKEYPAGILDKHIVYLARTENFNDDRGLDTEDPVYLYISTKTGENLTQITPKGIHVISWTISANKKMILVKSKRDKTGNKKFGNGDDEVYYRVDLEDDISKITCTEILL